VQHIERHERKLLTTDFTDEVGQIEEASVPYLTGGVNIAQYRKKVEQFLRSHQNHIVIHKILRAQPLTPLDLSELERFFFAAEGGVSRAEFEAAYGVQENLSSLIRSLVGLDRKAAKALFARYLDDKTCTADQIHFVNDIIDHLTKNGVMDPKQLYERPFTDYNTLGLDGLFDDERASDLIRLIDQINSSVAVHFAAPYSPARIVGA
jgi:type I restriction enzyme R subunit